MNYLEELSLNILKKEEGFRATAYYCSEGYPTIGYGRVIGAKGSALPSGTVNEKDEAEFVLSSIRQHISSLSVHASDAWEQCNTARRAILVSMVYQLGLSGLLKFKMALSSMSDGLFDSASLHMLDSKWATQTPNRAARHAEQMQLGHVIDYYL